VINLSAPQRHNGLVPAKDANQGFRSAGPEIRNETLSRADGWSCSQCEIHKPILEDLE